MGNGQSGADGPIVIHHAEKGRSHEKELVTRQNLRMEEGAAQVISISCRYEIKNMVLVLVIKKYFFLIYLYFQVATFKRKSVKEGYQYAPR